MNDIILIILIGIIAILVLKGYQILCNELNDVRKQNIRIEQRLFWSRRRELKMLKKLK